MRIKTLALLLIYLSAAYGSETQTATHTLRLITKDSPTEYISSASQDCRVTFTDTKHNNQKNDDYIKNYSPIKSWSCVNAGEALQYGYSTDHEKITYLYNSRSWELSSHDNQKSNTRLYNIRSNNSYGYLITRNAKPYNFHFCMIQEYQALCGDGEIPTTDITEISRLKKILSSFQFETDQENN
ncbi:hypothetical protein IB260_03335 [Pseudomonas sp. PDM23]|uniref:hypothetical protein n=1 Tax=unclassified Pseudomonas TaxID=196821 RepID=UPI00177ACEE7|nr:MULTISPECIES: hypothetical protein [unclassified Pseudomonas]MBD9574333.1 hypothetical protein [Pseudomonas sp. PDM23]MBD9673289.1 hypothetical protein [Pseudomonas sp. PDM21]